MNRLQVNTMYYLNKALFDGDVKNAQEAMTFLMFLHSYFTFGEGKS